MGVPHPGCLAQWRNKFVSKSRVAESYGGRNPLLDTAEHLCLKKKQNIFHIQMSELLPQKHCFCISNANLFRQISFQCWRRVKWVSSVSDHPSVPESILASVYSSFSKPRYSTFQRLRYKISRHCVVIHPRKPIVSQLCAMFCVLCGTRAAHSRNIALKIGQTVGTPFPHASNSWWWQSTLFR